MTQELPKVYVCSRCGATFNSLEAATTCYRSHGFLNKELVMVELTVFDTTCGRCGATWQEVAPSIRDLPGVFRCPVCKGLMIRRFQP